MIQDLVPDDADHLKRLAGSDGVDEHIAMDANEVLRVQQAVLVLLVKWSDSTQPAACERDGNGNGKANTIPLPPPRYTRSQEVESSASSYKEGKGRSQLTCPAVSMISVAKS